MDRQELILRLREAISSYLESQALELVELVYRYEGKNLFLRILTDRPDGGITLGECARLNQELGEIVDKLAILQDRCILEVSSPGLDRPLFTQNDFARCKDRQVKLFLKTPITNKLDYEGLIQKVEGDSVFIEVGGSLLEIPIANIKKGVQVLT